MRGSLNRARPLSAAVTLCALALVFAGAARASNASIKAAFASGAATLQADQAGVNAALGQFRTSRDPAPARAALAHYVRDLIAIRSRVAAQPPSSPRGKRGKASLQRGLSLIIRSFRQLDGALAGATSNPAGARRQIDKALRNVKQAAAQIQRGARLLS